MNKILILAFVLIWISSLTVFAQPSLSKSDILEKIQSVRHSKKKTASLKLSDTTYLFTFYPKFENDFFVDFFKSKPSKQEIDGTWLIYSFYFSGGNLLFIQTRQGKKISRYFLNKGLFFQSDLDSSLPILSQQSVDFLTKQVQAVRERT